MLYAGKTYKIYNYINLLFINNVKILYNWVNQQEIILSLINNIKSSETISNNNLNINYNIYKNKISEHLSKYYKPLNDNDLGYYLAGLIDAKGIINKNNGNIIINYNVKDIQALYWLKSKLKYGKVKKLNESNYNLIISNNKGLLFILNIINNKLKLISKYNDIFNYLINNNDYIKSNFNNNFELSNNNLNFNNHWLSGFIDGNGIFNTNINYDNNNLPLPIINLKFKLKLNTYNNEDLYILNDISYFICNINNKYKNDNNNISYYCLEFDLLNINKNIICYLDKYPLVNNSNYLKYLYFRKTYIYIKHKLYLNELGLKKINKFNIKINKL